MSGESRGALKVPKETASNLNITRMALRGTAPAGGWRTFEWPLTEWTPRRGRRRGALCCRTWERQWPTTVHNSERYATDSDKEGFKAEDAGQDCGVWRRRRPRAPEAVHIQITPSQDRRSTVCGCAHYVRSIFGRGRGARRPGKLKRDSRRKQGDS